MKKLAIITTHPIQYYAPVFQLLHQRQKISIKVFYTLGDGALQPDKGFGKVIEWDIPLLNGYPYQWVGNSSARPGSHHFKGIINPGLNRAVESWAPDAVLVFGWAYHGHLKLIRYFSKKIPVYFRGDSTLLDRSSGLRQLVKKLWLRWVYSHIDHAFYVGTNNKAYFKAYGLKEHQLSFAPHSVDNQRFGINRDTEAKELREKLKVGETDILVLFAGKLEQKKSPDVLLQAFMALNDANLHLLFVGNGILEDGLKDLAVNHKNIHFIDFQNQSRMPVIYRASNLFCLPSAGPGETWGLAVNEAMACGKAILVSDKVGCAKDLVHEGENGLICKPDNAADLAEKLRSLTSDKAQLIKMGLKSAEIIKDWSFLHIAAAIENKALNETDRSH